MKTLLAAWVIFCCLSMTPAQTKKRRVSIVVSIARSAPINSAGIDWRHLAAAGALNFVITKRWSASVGLSKSFDPRPPTLSARLSFRLY